MRKHLPLAILAVTIAALALIPARFLAVAASFPPTQDSDGDGLPDVQEDKNGNNRVDAGETDPMNADTDRGGEADGSEVKAGRNPLLQSDDFTFDADGDGWANGVEMMNGTDPRKADTDGDGVIDSKDPFPLDPKYSKDDNHNGLPDEWELSTGLIPSSSSSSSTSSSSPSTSTTPSITSSSSGSSGSSPSPSTTPVPSKTDDPDGDGLTNEQELNLGTNPLSKDTDSDGVDDGTEVKNGTDPLKADSDGDGTNDGSDAFPLDSRYTLDLNGNGLPDEWEAMVTAGKAQSIGSATDDADHDGMTNGDEFKNGTNPLNADSDYDGIDDKTEIETGTNPRENACLALTGSTVQFPDMAGHWANDEVTTLQKALILPSHTQLVTGYIQTGVSPLFRPDQPVTRFEFLKMALLSTCTRFVQKTDTVRPQFTDVRSAALIREKPDSILRRQVIYSAVAAGIVEGYADNTFRPDDPVNRAEAVKMLALAAHLADESLESTEETPSFNDVPASEWYAKTLNLAAGRGIVRGYGDGSFKPGNAITRAEAAAIIARTILQNPTINGYVLLGK